MQTLHAGGSTEKSRNVLFWSTRPNRRVVGNVLRAACEDLGAHVVVLSRALLHVASDVAEVVVFDLSDETDDPHVQRDIVLALRTFERGHVLAVAEEGLASAGLESYGLRAAVTYRIRPGDPPMMEGQAEFFSELQRALVPALLTYRRGLAAVS